MIPAAIRRQAISLLIPLLATTWIVVSIFPIWTFPFLQFEDTAYVSENPIVANGLNLKTAKAAFTTAPEANWIPLTWLALATQTELSGPPPQATTFRLTSLLLHSLAGILLWRLLSGKKLRWLPLIATTAFLIHPQRVESVAWISAQKDLWATLWFLASALCYAQTLTQSPHSHPRWRYLSILFFAASLLCKASAVSAPLLIIIIEYTQGKTLRNAIKHSLPYFLISLLVVAISWQVNTTEQLLFDPNTLHFIERLTRASAIICHHFTAFFYPHSQVPEIAPPTLIWPWTLGGILIITTILIGLFTNYKKIFLPLFAWLILLIPVSGIVPSPMLYTSDRMHQLPALALSFSLLALLHHLQIKTHKLILSISILLCTLILTSWTYQTRHQTTHWKNAQTLFQHTINLYPNHALAHTNLGVYSVEKDNFTTAKHHFIKATQGDRPLFTAWTNLIILHQQEKNHQAAIDTAQGLTTAYPNRAESWFYLANAHLQNHNPQSALTALRKADSLRPDSLMILNAMTQTLIQLGQHQEANQIQSRIPPHLRQQQ